MNEKYLIAHYDSKEIDFESVKLAYDVLVEKFPDKEVIMLPRAISIDTADKDILEMELDLHKQSIQILERLLNE